MAEEVELPECPVCLQQFDGVEAVPRVLPCGHSACEPCLVALPPARPSLPDSLRCPACTLLVPFPRSRGGPRSLPKNIDLLRLCDSLLASQNPNPNPNPNPSPKPNPKPPPEPLDDSFFPLPWTQRHLLSDWEDSVLPPDSLTLLSSESETEAGAAVAATVSSPLGRPWFCREGQRVSLLPVGALPSSSPAQTRWFRPSYMARVMDSLRVLGDEARAELTSLVEASGRLRRGLCKVCGLWMDPGEEKSQLFLVSERFDKGLADVLKEERRLSEEMLGSFPLMGMEMCEAVMGLHSQGIVCGCLEPSSFCFDEYRHCLLDLNQVLLSGRRIRGFSSVTASCGKGGESYFPTKTQVYLSPEVFVSLLEEGAAKDCGFEGSIGYGSDVWSLAFIFATILMGDAILAAELTDSVFCFLTGQNLENFAKSYDVWKEKVASKLEALLSGAQYEPFLRILISCLSYHPESRPQLSDMWRCIQGLFIKTFDDDVVTLGGLTAKENQLFCLVLANICHVPKETNRVSPSQESSSSSTGIPATGVAGSSGSNANQLQTVKIDGDLIKGLHRNGFKSITLQGHRDCVTGLAVGGGFLLSSSFDKTINVWSLQDFSQVQSLRGHEHKVMAIVVVNDACQPLCISGDSGSGIFVWSIGTPLGQEPLRKWYEHRDWRFSGIHSLAVSDTGFLYSGSGDKSIKAWSLQDYSLSFTMMGHKSTVSSLAVADGILYSGSWDGTIRLWWLNDHSPLSVLGDDQPGNLAPVLSLTFNSNLLVASCENGRLKMWRNDVPVSSEQVQNGAIFALHMDKKLLFSGGWDKVIMVQELSENALQVDIRHIASINCDSVITSLLYWHGKLFVGFSNKEIKVFHFGS